MFRESWSPASCSYREPLRGSPAHPRVRSQGSSQIPALMNLTKLSSVLREGSDTDSETTGKKRYGLRRPRPQFRLLGILVLNQGPLGPSHFLYPADLREGQKHVGRLHESISRCEWRPEISGPQTHQGHRRQWLNLRFHRPPPLST